LVGTSRPIVVFDDVGDAGRVRRKGDGSDRSKPQQIAALQAILRKGGRRHGDHGSTHEITHFSSGARSYWDDIVRFLRFAGPPTPENSPLQPARRRPSILATFGRLNVEYALPIRELLPLPSVPDRALGTAIRSLWLI